MNPNINPLTVQQVIDALTQAVECGQVTSETILEIAIEDSSLGGHFPCPVACVAPGFDWDTGRIFLIPQKKLISKP